MTQAQLKDAYERFGHLVYRRCACILRDDAAAKDALQEVFVRVWSRPEAFEAAQSKLRWLSRVAERICFDALDHRARTREQPLEPEHEQLRAVPSPAGAVDDADVVMRFVERFDERTRQVAVLYYLDGLTHEEIAQETGWSRQTVRKKLVFLQERAAALRKLLTGEEART